MNCVTHDLARKGATKAAFFYQGYSLCALCFTGSATHVHLGGSMAAVIRDAIEVRQLP